MKQDDDQVGKAERESVAVVRVRDGERDHEEAAHASDKQQPEAQPVRRDRVRQPRIPVVHPPDQEQHHDDLHECCEPLAVDEDACQLRDREDEDEIEEELEGRNANAALSDGAGRQREPRSITAR